ncbi:putative fructosyl peptide oxidase [Diaporthe ampelina]|uniref:Putative fructosyl peptide oxidase n=1 Tax=Diaporthe ampelina TaxID=1214573 RepID=A0A0G2FRA5_9PEZI|nr:putative fructosyl peptide oxidase [Diaporthe ampelina]
MSVQSRPNIAVVGGGIVGASIAWHLSHEANVTIVAENIGGTATPNSFAWLNAAAGNPKFYYDFRHRSMERWKEMAAELPDLPIHWGGSLNWNMSPDELEAYLDEHSSWGYDIVRVSRTEMQQREPALQGAVLPEWGLYAAEEGAVEAHVAARQLIADAEARGATLLNGKVTGFLKQDGRISGVGTAAGAEAHADHVVLAAGVGSVPLLAAENVTLPVTAVAGLLVNSRPTGARLLNGIVNAEQLHLRQTLDGRIRSGSEFSGGDPGDDPQKTAEELFGRVKAAVAGGDELEFDYFTVGYRPTPEDGLPILGPTGLDGLTVAVMHSGVTNAAIVGQLLSQQILTGVSDPALSNFELGRFDQNRANK